MKSTKIKLFDFSKAYVSDIGGIMMYMEKTSMGLKIYEGECILELRVINECIIRVLYYKANSTMKKDSLIVKHNTHYFKEWHMSDDYDKVELYTNKVKVIYSKGNCSLTFLDLSTGEIILKEKSDKPRILSEAQLENRPIMNIEQVFMLEEDEVIQGFGQQQDGYMDYKGRFVYLCQYNIINAVPVMVSNKGYGILWDNYSITKINRCMEQIKLKFDPYTKTWIGDFIPEEDGRYNFVVEKLNKNRGIEKISVYIAGEEIISRETQWHPNYWSGEMSLKKGEKYNIIVDGTVRLYYQPPSMMKYLSIWSEIANCIDYYFMYGPELDQVINCYRILTGKVPMFGKWAYGFWQSRETYNTGEELLNIIEEYRKRKHPLDNIIQDWKYWKSYGWNALKFHPDYAEDMGLIIKKIHDQHVRIMVSVWPNFGDEEQNEAYHVFKENKYLLDDSVLSKYIGNYTATFQGPQRNFIDVFNDEACNTFWKYMKKGLFDLGVDAWWLDANEPNLASIQGIFHLYQTCKGPAAKLINVYSLIEAKNIYENQRKETNEKRVFILSRTGFAGQQRYASAVWSGDIYCSWDVFKRQIPAGINYCLSGLPYWCTDIGGFAGGNSEDPSYRELYVRWFQYGAFCPIFRAHGTGFYREIWQFGQEAEKIMHDYLMLRYRLMPYIYSVAWMVTKDNYTMLRGLIMDFRLDQKASVICDQFMFGPSIMVCPVTEMNARKRMVYLPKGSGWYDFWTGEYYNGGQDVLVEAPLKKIPLFIKEGSIIPMGPEIQYTDEKLADPIELRIYSGKDAQFVLYEDEGDSYRYEEGYFTEIPIYWNENKKELVIEDRSGYYPGMLKERLFNYIIISKDIKKNYNKINPIFQDIKYLGGACNDCGI